MTDKEKIDYKIKAKIDARNKEIEEWGCAMFLALFVVILISFGFSVLFGN